MTSPDDQLDGIFSQIAAQDQVDPALFDQTLEAAFDYTGSGFEELIPDGSDALDVDEDGDAVLFADPEVTFDESDNTDTGDTDTDDTAPDDHTYDHPDPTDTYSPDDIDI